MEKSDSFLKFLDTTSLDKNNKKALISMMDFIHGKDIPELSDKSFLFEGEPGIGKTYVAEKLIDSVDLPVLFLGSSRLKGKNIVKVDSLTKLIEKIEDFKQGIIFIDDLKYSLNFDVEMDELQDEERKRFMTLLEYLKKSDKRVVIIMTLNSSDFMDDSWIDRIEVKIDFNLPSEENKLSFLKENFGKYVKTNELKYLAKNSIGYNYRDLPQLIKIAYREGNKIINLYGIKKALNSYNPSGLRRWNIKRDVKTKFKNVIGHDNPKKELKKLLIYIKQRKKLSNLGIKQSNLIIFSGNPGVGKTYMAAALAGELGLPLVKVNAIDVHIRGSLVGITNIMNVAKKFKNSVIFMDDVDKVLGGNPLSYDDEGPPISEFNTSVENEDVQGVIILAANNINRLGRALKDRFSIISFDEPSLDNRKEFARRLIGKSKLDLKINEDYFAKITENMNYRQMQRIWNECIFYYLENNTLNNDILEKFVFETNEDSINKSSMFG